MNTCRGGPDFGAVAAAPGPVGPVFLALSLDELRTIVFETSVAYANAQPYTQQAEWARAAALRDALERLGYTRESEMIGGAG